MLLDEARSGRDCRVPMAEASGHRELSLTGITSWRVVPGVLMDRR